MKILFVLESYYPNVGGLETLFASLVNELALRGHTITVLTNRSSQNMAALEEGPNITIRRYRFYNRYLFTLFAFFPAFWHASDHDFIQTTSYNAALPAYFAGLLRGKKVFITFHEYWGDLWFSLPYFGKVSLWGHYLFEKIIAKIPFFRFIAVSKHTRDRLVTSGIPKEKVDMIYNGILYDQWRRPTNKLAAPPSDPFRFIYFGRLGISKGLNILLEASASLKSSGGNFQVVLILPKNPNKFYEHLKKLMSKLELQDIIKIWQHLPKSDLINKIVSADAVVIPSYNEGFCYTAVESIALGMPVISSQRGALPEVVSGRFLALPTLNVENLAQAMQAAIDGKWQHSEVRRFHLGDTVDQYIALYQSIYQSAT